MEHWVWYTYFLNAYLSRKQKFDYNTTRGFNQVNIQCAKPWGHWHPIPTILYIFHLDKTARFFLKLLQRGVSSWDLLTYAPPPRDLTINSSPFACPRVFPASCQPRTYEALSRCSPGTPPQSRVVSPHRPPIETFLPSRWRAASTDPFSSRSDSSFSSQKSRAKRALPVSCRLAWPGIMS